MASKEFRPAYALLLIVAMAVAVFAWWLLRPPARPGPDMVQVLTLNNEGVGLMEQFEYDRAAEVFEIVVELAPDWLPGKINLGIATLNQLGMKKEGQLEPWQKALGIFDEVLQNDPENLYAHFCTGIILQNQGRLEEARPRFEFVTKKDPHDAHAWYWLSETYPPFAEECYRFAKKALDLNRYLAPALTRVHIYLSLHEPEEAQKYLTYLKELGEARHKEKADLKYTQMGKYAEVIGRPPTVSHIQTGPLPFFTAGKPFQVQLATGARWATAADFGQGEKAKLRRAVRQRFGAVLVVLDYDRDDRPDLFLLGAVVEAGQVRDLLLRNEGDGIFRDVTREVGLANSGPGLGCCVGDFNNDGFPDLLITGAGRQWLFTNVAGAGEQRRFQDETKKAGLDAVSSVCLGAMWIDLDQDGDLDLLLCQYADTPREALAAMQKRSSQGPGLAVFLNVGTAPPVEDADTKPLPLTTAFRQPQNGQGPAGPGANVVNLAAADLDRDHDLDLVLLADQHVPELILNDRLLSFHSVKLPGELASSGRWNGALVFNSRNHERSDLLLLPHGEKPLLLINQPGGNEKDINRWFEKGITNSPPLISAQAIDLDLDGWTDIVGLAEDCSPIFLHNDGQRLVQVPRLFGPEDMLPADLMAVAAVNILGNGFPDVLLWSEKDGLLLRQNQGNGNHGLALQVTGRRKQDQDLRSNADGFGTWVVAQAGTLWTGGERTTRSAGLGQSSQPLLLGLGKYPVADVVRLHWPDQIRQAELSIPAGSRLITQTNRTTDSCPLLFTWNGERFVFVNDILGAGAMGEAGPGGAYRPPRPEESIKIEAHQLAAKDGKYPLKIAEIRDEIAYLDHFELAVADHPPELLVYPDERFAAPDPEPKQDLLVFRKGDRIFPVRATNHKGKDMTAALKEWDRETASHFAPRSWLGYAEEHWIELDFGDRLAQFGPQDKLLLCLAGWTAYPYPDSIWAADQAGVNLLPPVLEQMGKNGQWQIILADMGFPAGLPRLITIDVSGLLSGPTCKQRIRTNMQIFWDQVYVVPLLERLPHQQPFAPKHVKVHSLPVAEADLQYRGFLQEFSPDGKKPFLYNHERLEPTPVPSFSGHLTRFGPVGSLLKKRDNRFVLMGPGDELTMWFDTRELPALPAGWQRSFVLRSHGYSRSGGTFIAEGGKVEPLPFFGMKNFPYGPAQHYPQTPLHLQYLKEYNTRKIGPVRP